MVSLDVDLCVSWVFDLFDEEDGYVGLVLSVIEVKVFFKGVELGESDGIVVKVVELVYGLKYGLCFWVSLSWKWFEDGWGFIMIYWLSFLIRVIFLGLVFLFI